ncbi:MAG TPA: NUDIX domain-containing protein, partial [Thermoanaerobaculia bacterium]|nr:NUDIX domain-containing protein [Thermoanaerobaculia bacterium]
REVPLDDVRAVGAAKFAEVFERELVDVPPTIRLIQVLAHDGNGRVLLLHRKPERGNVWQPVTGSIENGESAEACARRELFEETGQRAEIEPIDLQQSFMIESNYLAARFPLPIVADQIAFAAQLDPEAVIHLDADEHDDAGWFALTEAYEKIKWTDDREALERLEAVI